MPLMGSSPPLSIQARALLWGIAGVLALGIGWFVADRLTTYREAKSLEEALEAHAWSMRQLEAGGTYELASFAAPVDPGEVPTFQVTMNRFLVRDREFSDRPAPGVQRIIAVGDSTTFGTGVAVADRFTETLQRRLEGRYPGRYEVLNAGRAGMDARASLDLVEQRIWHWQPSVLIFGAMTNDLRDPEQSQRLRKDDAHLEAYEQTLEALVQRSVQQEVPLVFWSNTVLDSSGEDPLKPYHRRMSQVGARHGIPVVSLAAVYRERPATGAEQENFLNNRPWVHFWPEHARVPIERAALHMDWAHPNAYGHARLADALLPALETALGLTTPR
jgi:lysophospholipase L1-like esterase